MAKEVVDDGNREKEAREGKKKIEGGRERGRESKVCLRALSCRSFCQTMGTKRERGAEREGEERALVVSVLGMIVG